MNFFQTLLTDSWEFTFLYVYSFLLFFFTRCKMQKFPFKAALSLTAFSAAMLIASAPAEAREITAAVATGFTTLDP